MKIVDNECRKYSKNIYISLFSILFTFSCSQVNQVDNINGNAYSLNSHQLNSNILSTKEMKLFDKEYSFSTKALTANYFKKKCESLISKNNGNKLVRELEYARIKGESFVPVQAIFNSDPTFYNTVTAVPNVISERSINSAFHVFLGGVDPYPAVPTNLLTNGINSNGFTVNWSAISGATSYDLIIDNGTPINLSNANSYTVTGLVAGTTHTWKVRANKNTLNSSYTSNQSIVTTPNIPSSLSTTNISGTGFTANWSDVSGATSYDISINNGNNINVSGTSYIATGLTGTTHTWKVRANNTTSSAFSSNQTVNAIVPATPTGLTTSAITLSGFTASWTPVSGATSYDIIIDNGTNINIASGTTYTATGLTGANHTWKVRANNGNSGNYTTSQSVIIAYSSCKTLLNSGINTNGIYWLDTDGSSGNHPFKAYCDMTTSGGGWTMVVAQYENDPVTNWNEGIQSDYDPSLATRKGFALNTAQLPADRSQIAFGADLNPTYVDYSNFVYTTGAIPKTLLSGLKTSSSYHIHRDPNGYYSWHNPDESYFTGSDWVNTFTYDKITIKGFSWAFSPNQNLIYARSYSMNGADLQTTYEPNLAWTVWVR